MGKKRNAANKIALIALSKFDEIEVVDKDLDGFILFTDHKYNNIVIANAVMLDRPIMNADAGNISRKEFEHVIDKLLDEREDVDMFIRFDIIHVFINEKTDRAIIRHYRDAIPYEK